MTDVDTTVDEMRVRVWGHATGWQRARVSHAQRRHFDDPKTKRGMADIVLAWIDAGAPRLHPGPVAITVIAVMERPKTHYLRGGDLSAIGRRLPFPIVKPDWDNIAKLIGDALNAKAYHDDAHIVRATVAKVYAARGERGRTDITLSAIPVPEAA